MSAVRRERRIGAPSYSTWSTPLAGAQHAHRPPDTRAAQALALHLLCQSLTDEWPFSRFYRADLGHVLPVPYFDGFVFAGGQEVVVV